ncbi:GRIP and coiled-coil domain-containing protein 2-like [Daktulosphaira vitifoliae]|uniref:GRIP and coiled-coil domain-containing protein 2-like n=1 Tax=Daktulosphaira vitifoliae TaxID=58002 RepID=UPI0021A9AD73|nr:GRIP and coiled-coil domain-containing protein 2-like [Daktulosphaira vitifoliae]
MQRNRSVMEVHNSTINDSDLENQSKEDILNRYRNEIFSLKKENDELHNQEKIWEQKFHDQQHIFEQSERQEILEKNKLLCEADLLINEQQKIIKKLNNQHIVEKSDEVDALKKKLHSYKTALEAMKKNLDNEKAFKICAEEKIKQLEEQINSKAEKEISLENRNSKLAKENEYLEVTLKKLRHQCNELLEKNIMLENHCEKKEKAFDKQTKYVDELKEKVAEIEYNKSETELLKLENEKISMELLSVTRQLESYENKCTMYVQSLQKTQCSENELKSTVNKLQQENSINYDRIIKISNDYSELSTMNSNLTTQINSLLTNFSSCLKFLDEIFERYVIKDKDDNKLASVIGPLINEIFDILNESLLELKSCKQSHLETINTYKNVIMSKEKQISLLIKEIDTLLKQGSLINCNIIDQANKCSILKQSEFKNIKYLKNAFNDLEKNFGYIKEIKTELLPRQKQLICECEIFLMENVKNIEDLYIKKNIYIENLDKLNKKLKIEIVEKNNIIVNLNEELKKLKERLNEKSLVFDENEIELKIYRENLYESSTISISRADEVQILEEIDNSKDERLQKLKAVVIKQKKIIFDLKQSLDSKVKKHNNEKSELVAKITSLAEQGKIARCLQQQYDIKCDEYDEKCKETKNLVKQLNQEKKLLLDQTKLCSSLNIEIEKLKNDLVITNKSLKNLKENDKLLVSKLEKLKQEKSAGDIMRVDRETFIKELSKKLKDSNDKIKLLESEITSLKSEKKKINIRDLELNSYEKTIDELSEKIKEENLHNQNLEQEISNSNNVIDSLHEQIKHLEHTISTEQERNQKIAQQMELCRKGLNNAESLLNEKENFLIEIQSNLDQERILNNIIEEKYNKLKLEYDTEKENYQSQQIFLNDKIRRLQTELNAAKVSITKYTKENQGLIDEFEAYKVRAHSVFQKHKQDTVYNVKIDELTTQLQEVTKVLQQYKINLQIVTTELNTKNVEVVTMKNEVEKYEKRLNSVTKILGKKDKALYHLNIETENIKSKLENEIKILNDKIVNDKIKFENDVEILQQEIMRVKETKNINSKPDIEFSEPCDTKLKKTNSLVHIQDDEVCSQFESSNESLKKLNKSGLMPLEDLLIFDNNSVGDALSELNNTQKQLKQLTIMLNDAEKNCSRYEQQNKFLKEDIRRLQRSVDRHDEIKNMEYLKNIIFKFITSNGVEKCHLVPVINKLLKLSPDEQKQIETIAKGAMVDQGSSWSNLFTWTQGTSN